MRGYKRRIRKKDPNQAARTRKHYEANREKIVQRVCAWQRENRARKNENDRKRYWRKKASAWGQLVVKCEPDDRGRRYKCSSPSA